MSRFGRGSVSREEAERLERVWSFIRHHPPSLPLMPRLLSWRLTPHHRPPTFRAHLTAPTMTVQASHGRDCSSSSSSSSSSSINGTGGAVLDRRLVMLLVRRLKERHRHQHALEAYSGVLYQLARTGQHSLLASHLPFLFTFPLPAVDPHQAYSGVLYQLARTGQHSRLQEELQWLHGTAGAAVGVSAFNARLLALSSLPSRLASADSVTQRMDEVTRPMHVARIAAHVAAGDIAMAEEAFASLHACIRRLDRDVCNALLKGYTRANMPDAALRLVDDMRRASIPCGTATLSLLLSCLSRSHRLSHATALLSQLVTTPETPVTVDPPPPATTNPPSTPLHPKPLPESVLRCMSPPASPRDALPSHRPPRHHGSQPPTPPPTIKRRTLRGLMEALKAEGHVEGVRQAMRAGEAMWGCCEVAWYKLLLGAMLRRTGVHAGKGEGGDGEGSSKARWEEAAREVEEEMRVKGVRADHEVRGLLRKLRGLADVQQGRAACGDDVRVE
ncbi:unnamed protein product [Closterium sp. Yama58-4]|nr:unnamed protein product [Closterium sp. Yama58-4]